MVRCTSLCPVSAGRSLSPEWQGSPISRVLNRSPQQNPSSAILQQNFSPHPFADFQSFARQPNDTMAPTSLQHSRALAPRDVMLHREMILLQDTREYDSSDWHSRPSSPSPSSSGSEGGLGNTSHSHIRLNSDATLVLGWEIREEPHFKAYGVMDQWRRPLSDLVARVYRLDVPRKVRRYRLRCITRLASRAMLEVSVPNFRIIICWSGVKSEAACIGVPSLQNPSEFASFEDLEKKNERTESRLEIGVVETTREVDQEHEPKIGDAYPKKKSAYQQESNKARQRERRQAARRAKQESSTVAEPPANPKGHSDGTGNHTAVDQSPDDSGNTEDLSLITFLYLAYDEKGQLYEHIPASAYRELRLHGMIPDPLVRELWRYLDKRTIDFTSAGQLQEYLAFKQSEIIFLKRQKSKMGRIEQHYKNQLLLATGELQTRRAFSPDQWKAHPQELIQIVQTQLKMVRHVTTALPEVIRRARERRKKLESRMEQVRQQEEESRRRECFQSRLELETERMLDKWTRNFIPGPKTYWAFRERWKAG